MIVPPQQLSEDALTGIIEDWLSRQTQETAADQDQWSALVGQVRQQILAEELALTWDDESQTINIQLRRDVPRPSD